MSTNGDLYTRGHRLTAEPSWADAVLTGTQALTGLVNWTDGANKIVAYRTTAGVQLVNSSLGLQVGRATLANVTALYRLGAYLYLGTSAGGVYRLTIPATTTEHGDITPSPWTAYLTTATTPAIYHNRVTSLYGWVSTVDADAWLAVACGNGLGTGGDRVTLVNQTEATAYDSALWCFGADAKLYGAGTATMYVVVGRFVYVVYDAESPAFELADNWWADATAAGNPDDDHADGSLADWNRYGNDAGCTGVETGGALVMHAKTAADGVTGNAGATLCALPAGDFDVSQKCAIASNYDVDLQTGRQCGNYMTIRFPHEASATANWWRTSVELERRVVKGSYNRLYAHINTEAGHTESYVSFTPNTWWWRIVRSGSTITTYYKSTLGDPWTLLKQFTGCATSPVLVQCTGYTTDDGYDHESSFDDLTWTRAVDGTAYAAELPAAAIVDLAIAPGTSEAGTDTLGLAFADGSAWLVDTDQSVPRESEGGGYAHPLDVHDATAIGLTADAKADTSGDGGGAGAGRAAVGTIAGIAIVDLTDDSLYAQLNTASYPPLVDDGVVALQLAGSWFYATGSGGGWVDAEGEIPDAEAIVDTVRPDVGSVGAAYRLYLAGSGFIGGYTALIRRETESEGGEALTTVSLADELLVLQTPVLSDPGMYVVELTWPLHAPLLVPAAIELRDRYLRILLDSTDRAWSPRADTVGYRVLACRAAGYEQFAAIAERIVAQRLPETAELDTGLELWDRDLALPERANMTIEARRARIRARLNTMPKITTAAIESAIAPFLPVAPTINEVTDYDEYGDAIWTLWVEVDDEDLAFEKFDWTEIAAALAAAKPGYAAAWIGRRGFVPGTSVPGRDVPVEESEA